MKKVKLKKDDVVCCLFVCVLNLKMMLVLQEESDSEDDVDKHQGAYDGFGGVDESR